MPLLGARVAVCVDDAAAIAPLAVACARHGTEIEVLIEIDCGAGVGGIAPDAVVPLAQTIVSAGLNLTGLQAAMAKCNISVISPPGRPRPPAPKP